MGQIQESYTEILTFTSSPISSFSYVPIPPQYGNVATDIIPSVHEISFITPYALPSSIVQSTATQQVSYIKINYLTVPASAPKTGVLPDLGFGVNVPTKIPCKAIEGLNAVVGNNINCTLYPQAAPYIIVQNYAAVPKGASIFLLIPHPNNPYIAQSTNTISADIRIILKQNRLLTYSSLIAQNIAFTRANALSSRPPPNI